MQSEKSLKTRHSVVSGAATASLALTFSAIPAAVNAEPAKADEKQPAQSEGDSVVLDQIVIEGANSTGNVNSAPIGIARLPGTVKETPKIVNVVPHQLIEQQQATTLEQVLRNVPGITLSTGEGNGGQNGDQFRIRGLTSKGDVYLDGLRDFGVYTRDSFNTESVEVIKGPSGEAFGVGNLGGVINQTTKRAHLETRHSIDQGFGTGPAYRTLIDSNYKINDTTAVRVNGMFNRQDVADRDHVKADRWGGAIDFATGIGTDQEWHLNYFYLHGDKTPDYGVPMLQGKDGILRPLTEYDIPGIGRSQSYVRSTDRDITNTHVITSLYSKELENGITINNDTRLSIYDRDFSSTNPAACIDECATAILGGLNYNLSYGAQGGMTYKQDGWAIQNVLSAKGEFTTGALRHRAMVGLDVNYQDDKRSLGSWTGRPSNQMIIDPQYDYPGASVKYGATKRSANATDVGVFVSDRVWITDEFSLQGNLRWDYFRSEFDTTATSINGGTATSEKISPAFSAIWEPTQDYTFYASFARTYRPVGTDIAAAVGGVGSEVPQADMINQPERADTYEIGAKADFLDGRLGASIALFRINKNNSYTIDPVTGDIVDGFSDNGQGRRVSGVEVGLSGKITENWTTYLAYAYLDGKVTYASDASLIGNDAPGVPNHNVSLWTAYEFPEIANLPGNITVGGGIQYASKYWSDSANTARMPENFSLDAMVAYKKDNFRVSLNAYNLTDHLNYSSSFNNSRAVPMSGRTFMLNIGTTF
ncbi:TonB-dependent receptor [Daeguia caeni]|uniref:Heme transporter BhuA n=1 Tax=Daeguia caeni TaxID=439612 RepID=A0ABV9H8J5_9HYPH